jgi:hypothetical protein
MPNAPQLESQSVHGAWGPSRSPPCRFLKQGTLREILSLLDLAEFLRSTFALVFQPSQAFLSYR